MDLGAAKHEPVTYRYGGDPAQFGELWLPEGAAAGTVVVIHGGFWRARYDLSLGRPLAEGPSGDSRVLRQAERAIGETAEHHAHVRLRPLLA